MMVLVASLVAAVPDQGLGWPAMTAAATASLLHWPLWAAVSHLVGGKLLGGAAAWGPLLRGLGFARAPGVLLLLDPLIGGVGLLVQLWMLAAGAAAIRHGLGLGLCGAVFTAVLGALPYWLVLALVLH